MSGTITKAIQPCVINTKQSPLKSTTDSVTIKCQHRDCPADITFFEIVPDAAAKLPYKDTITVNWVGPNKPSALTISNYGDVAGGGIYTIPLSAKFRSERWSSGEQSIQLGLELLKDMNTYNQVEHFTIKGLPAGCLPVRLYNPEKWSVKISFPKFKSFKTGAKLEVVSDQQHGKKITAENNTEKSGWGYESDTNSKQTLTVTKDMIHTSQEASVSKDGKTLSLALETIVTKDMVGVAGQREYKKEPESSIKGITFSRNGSQLQFSVFDSIRNILRLISAIKAIQGIVNKVPKIGWYFELDWQILAGSLVVEWGWREYQPNQKGSAEVIGSHQAVYGVKVEGDIDLVSGKFEVGFGVEAGFKVQIFAFIEGEVKFNPSFDHFAPASEGFKANIAFPITGTLTGGGGARVEVGNIYKIEYTVQLSYSINAMLEIKAGEEPVVLSGSHGVSAIEGKVKESIGKEAKFAIKNSSTKPKEFMPPKEFGSFRWPSDEKDTEYQMTLDEVTLNIKSMLEGQLFQGGQLDKKNQKREFGIVLDHKSGLGTLKEEYFDLSNIANLMSAKINRHKIPKSRKNVEGICYAIRAELEKKMYKHWYYMDYLLYDDVTNFVLRGELDAICQLNIDPIQEAFN